MEKIVPSESALVFQVKYVLVLSYLVGGCGVTGESYMASKLGTNCIKRWINPS